ncbi:MAG TPA: hypothetical protein VFM55_27000, partial [Micromonosporaceae bacterium]|nr:hypothetical protein [Micromonosporaceae bacterium]
ALAYNAAGRLPVELPGDLGVKVAGVPGPDGGREGGRNGRPAGPGAVRGSGQATADHRAPVSP